MIKHSDFEHHISFHGNETCKIRTSLILQQSRECPAIQEMYIRDIHEKSLHNLVYGEFRDDLYKLLYTLQSKITYIMAEPEEIQMLTKIIDKVNGYD